MRRAVDRYVESLLRRRRPKPFAPNEDDIAVARTAVALAAGGPDAAQPREAFVDDLRRRLAAADPTAPLAAGSTAADRDQASAQRSAGRRRFLRATALTATGAAAGVAVGVAASDLAGRGGGGGGEHHGAEPEISPLTGVWQTVGSDAGLPEGGVIGFDLGSVVGFVHRAGGRLRAVSGICTHQGCRLYLAQPQQNLACPCHGATFTLAGQTIAHPFRMNHNLPPLPRLPLRVQDGDIQIYAPPTASQRT